MQLALLFTNATISYVEESNADKAIKALTSGISWAPQVSHRYLRYLRYLTGPGLGARAHGRYTAIFDVGEFGGFGEFGEFGESQSTAALVPKAKALQAGQLL